MMLTSRSSFTSNQRRGFLAAWGGIVLDGVDSFIYALVLVPALRALLPASGIEPTVGNVSFYGSILFSVFLVGWGLAFLWGPAADRFGRVRVLMLAILCYSLFTFLGALAQTWWQLAIFRLLAGFGIGGEFVGAATFVVEELPERRRVVGTGIMNSGYYVGVFIAAGLNYLVGANTDGARCLRSAAFRRCSSPTSGFTCRNRNAGATGSPRSDGGAHVTRFSRCSRSSIAAGPCSTACFC